MGFFDEKKLTPWGFFYEKIDSIGFFEGEKKPKEEWLAVLVQILFWALLNGDFRGGICEIVGGGGGRGGLVVPVDFAAGDAWIIGQNISFQLRKFRKKNDKIKSVPHKISSSNWKATEYSRF